jgi:hypothetical protein
MTETEDPTAAPDTEAVDLKIPEPEVPSWSPADAPIRAYLDADPPPKTSTWRKIHRARDGFAFWKGASGFVADANGRWIPVLCTDVDERTVTFITPKELLC